MLLEIWNCRRLLSSTAALLRLLVEGIEQKNMYFSEIFGPKARISGFIQVKLRHALSVTRQNFGSRLSIYWTWFEVGKKQAVSEAHLLCHSYKESH